MMLTQVECDTMEGRQALHLQWLFYNVRLNLVSFLYKMEIDTYCLSPVIRRILDGM